MNTQQNDDIAKHVTLGIKSFERPECTSRLYLSIRKFYPNINIYICDDSKNPRIPLKEMEQDPFFRFFPTEFDIGISAGRNLLVQATQTKYYVTLDDDHIFTSRTKLEILYDFLQRHNEITIAGGRIQGMRPYRMVMNAHVGDKIYGYEKPGHYGVLEDFLLTNRGHNFFMARTQPLKNLLWNEQLKILEHTEFFVRAWKAGWIVAYNDKVQVGHDRGCIANKHAYSKYRIERQNKYLQKSMQLIGAAEVGVGVPPHIAISRLTTYLLIFFIGVCALFFAL
jgi:GT2 family glycosyltransferase